MKITNIKHQASNNTKTKKTNNKNIFNLNFGILGLFVICILVLGIYLQGCAAKKEKPLETVKVTRGNMVANIPSTGIVTPRNRLEIKPPVSGRVEEVMVEEGDRVKKGQILAWISSSDRAALLDAARAKGAEELKYWEDVYKPAPIIAPIDGFIILRNVEPGQAFTVNDAVLVMADKKALRENRLGLLQRVSALADGVVDLSKLEGF